MHDAEERDFSRSSSVRPAFYSAWEKAFFYDRALMHDAGRFTPADFRSRGGSCYA